MTLHWTPLPVLNRRAYELLSKEWGVVDTLRFFSQFGWCTGNYTEERRALFADLTLEEYRRGVQGLADERTR